MDNELKTQGGAGAYTALIAAVFFWGLSFVATKVALESFTTFTLIFARFCLASCILTALILRRGLPRLNRKDHAKLFLTALFQPGLYFTFETLGLQHTTAPMAALIIATVPVAVLLTAFLFLGERTGPGSFLGIGLSLLGILILVTGDPQVTWTLGGRLLGNVLIFGAVISAALYMVCVRHLGREISALEITVMQFIYGTILFLPAFFLEMPGMQWSAISSRSLLALAFLVLFATFGGFLCYNHALTRIQASRAAVFINGIPVVTALGAWAMLGETLTTLQIGGGLLVLCGVYLTNRLGARRSIRPENV
ncbi:MAG: DMT family transporter [Deltaproteobacteria bacterium]|nr:DMT family transporter [Deltaproteobacteria bacterium]MBW1942383.1 DMT family transporter [Deltaproteobacteria bacterium]MBW2206591.1 DMT family transporter [Deltaproteobacteria bacterium]